jgi:hypothetical protein
MDPMSVGGTSELSFSTPVATRARGDRTDLLLVCAAKECRLCRSAARIVVEADLGVETVGHLLVVTSPHGQHGRHELDGVAACQTDLDAAGRRAGQARRQETRGRR